MKQEFIDRITKILDEAAGNKELSTEDYANLCRVVEQDAADRAGAAENDIKNQAGDQVDDF